MPNYVMFRMSQRCLYMYICIPMGHSDQLGYTIFAIIDILAKCVDTLYSISSGSAMFVYVPFTGESAEMSWMNCNFFLRH